MDLIVRALLQLLLLAVARTALPPMEENQADFLTIEPFTEELEDLQYLEDVAGELKENHLYKSDSAQLSDYFSEFVEDQTKVYKNTSEDGQTLNTAEEGSASGLDAPRLKNLQDIISAYVVFAFVVVTALLFCLFCKYIKRSFNTVLKCFRRLFVRAIVYIQSLWRMRLQCNPLQRGEIDMPAMDVEEQDSSEGSATTSTAETASMSSQVHKQNKKSLAQQREKKHPVEQNAEVAAEPGTEPNPIPE